MPNFFARLFHIIWPQLSNEEQIIIGCHFCDSMLLLGAPRVDIYYYSLANLGYSEQAITTAIDETYNTQEWMDRIKNRMHPTISLMKSVGVFSKSTVRDKLESCGLN